MSAKILFEGQGFIAVDKPPGTLVIPGRGEGTAVVLKTALEAQLGKRIFVVHRLDRDTSGVLLFALDEQTHRTLSMAFEAGRIEKKYLALVEGQLKEPLDLNLPLMPARRGRMKVARGGHDGKDARTLVRPLEELSAATLVEATPLTGRTHQIRVHLQSAGHPLIFDHQYGKDVPLGPEGVLARTPLHAATLNLPALEKIAPVTITSPLPADMRAVVEAWRKP